MIMKRSSKWTAGLLIGLLATTAFLPMSLAEVQLSGTTDVTAPVTQEPLPIKSALTYFEKMKKEHVSIYVKDLKSGRSYGINENFVNKEKDAGMMAASVIKLHLAYHVVREIEAKHVEWDKSYKDPVTGRKFTLRSEMKKMITVSDNGSYNTLLRFMKPADINKSFTLYGMPHTKVYAELGPAGDGWSKANNLKRYNTTKGGRINAFETAVMLEDIHAKRKDPNMKVLHDFMLAVTNKDRIPSAVGKTIAVAHKTGSMMGDDGVFDDAGIVYGKNGTYIVCILVQKQHISIDKETRSAVKKAFETLEKMNAKQ